RLLVGDLAVDLQAKLSGGRVEAQADPDGQLQLELRGVEIGPLQQSRLPYRLQGKLNGNLRVDNSVAVLQGTGEFRLQLRDSFLLGLERIGLPERLDLGLLQLEGKFNQRRFSLEKILLTEGSVEMSGGGTLLLAETVEQTRLNLNIRLHPTRLTPDSFRNLLKLSGIKPTTDGSYLLRVAGTLAHPVLR
ncbi:MAG: type II secretion system protein GspN, partial [Deltaproteobacteria bacterium]|nr:type II secretion system protein GspN [Deltaproteobacteria bacterium]